MLLLLLGKERFPPRESSVMPPEGNGVSVAWCRPVAGEGSALMAACAHEARGGVSPGPPARPVCFVAKTHHCELTLPTRPLWWPMGGRGGRDEASNR